MGQIFQKKYAPQASPRNLQKELFYNLLKSEVLQNGDFCSPKIKNFSENPKKCAIFAKLG